MSVQPTNDTDEMSRRVMYVLLHEINFQPQTIDFNKDLVWETASSISGFFKEYGLGLKDTVFQALVQQQDIVDLGDTVAFTCPNSIKFRDALSFSADPPRRIINALR
jgi:hypothetical protein